MSISFHCSDARRDEVLLRVIEMLFVALFQITVYIGKRDFIDYLTRTDPIGKSASLV